MKKVLLVGAMALFAAVNAQTEKGTWSLGGSSMVGFNSLGVNVKADGDSESSPKLNLFVLTPSVGYFVSNGVNIGVDLNFLNASVSGTEETSASVFSILPNVTYYFNTANNTFKPYLGAGVGYSNVNATGVAEEKISEGAFTWSAKGGVAYFPNTNVGLNLGLGYQNISKKVEESTISLSNLGINAGISVFLK